MNREKLKYDLIGIGIGLIPYILIGAAMIFIYGGKTI